MRSSDQTKFQEPYPPDDPRSPDDQFRDALRLGVPSSRLLTQMILDDLSPRTLGIGWWDAVPTKRRILISDQLYLSAQAIETNLVEARLHMLEALALLDERSRRLELKVVVSSPEKFTLDSERPSSPAERISSEMAMVHVVGFFRAIGSAFDCVSAAGVGVAALPTNILKAGFTQFRQSVDAVSGASPGEVAQRECGSDVLTAIRNAGPKGWLEWVLGYRNMLVHRGRHTSLFFSNPVSRIALPTGGNRVVFDYHLLLSRSPLSGEIDTWRHDVFQKTLTEDARETIEGVWRSATNAIEVVCGLFVTLWKRRREDPKLLTQPETQWKHTTPFRDLGVRGLSAAFRADAGREYDAGESRSRAPASGVRIRWRLCRSVEGVRLTSEDQQSLGPRQCPASSGAAPRGGRRPRCTTVREVGGPAVDLQQTSTHRARWFATPSPRCPDLRSRMATPRRRTGTPGAS